MPLGLRSGYLTARLQNLQSSWPYRGLWGVPRPPDRGRRSRKGWRPRGRPRGARPCWRGSRRRRRWARPGQSGGAVMPPRESTPRLFYTENPAISYVWQQLTAQKDSAALRLARPGASRRRRGSGPRRAPAVAPAPRPRLGPGDGGWRRDTRGEDGRPQRAGLRDIVGDVLA
jgi:hypothetical protein